MTIFLAILAAVGWLLAAAFFTLWFFGRDEVWENRQLTRSHDRP